MKFLLETFGEIRPVGKTHFEGDFGNGHEIFAQQLCRPLQSIGPEKLGRGFAAQGMDFPVQCGTAHIKFLGQLLYIEFRVL